MGTLFFVVGVSGMMLFFAQALIADLHEEDYKYELIKIRLLAAIVFGFIMIGGFLW